MRNIEKINSDLWQLWEVTFRNEGEAYLPTQYPKPKQGALVFVGMNPSFSSKWWKSLLLRPETPRFDPDTFFQWPPSPDFNSETSDTIEALAHKYHPFFSPHRTLAQALNKNWEHFDLFAYRGTEQRSVRDLVLDQKNPEMLTKFGQKQFQVFNELLSLAKPAVVVVINALASQIYMQQRRPEFDTHQGCYQDAVGTHRFPVLLSGMLTGTRALDRFSRDRLFWHVAKAFNTSWSPAMRSQTSTEASPHS